MHIRFKDVFLSRYIVSSFKKICVCVCLYVSVYIFEDSINSLLLIREVVVISTRYGILMYNTDVSAILFLKIVTLNFLQAGQFQDDNRTTDFFLLFLSVSSVKNDKKLLKNTPTFVKLMSQAFLSNQTLIQIQRAYLRKLQNGIEYFI